MEKPTVEYFSPVTSIQEVDRQLFNEKPDLSLPSIKAYFASRLPTIIDLPIFHANERWYKLINPMTGLQYMTRSNWNYYFMGYFAWVLDALDYFVVSVAAPEIATTLKVSVTDITWGITLVLMLRSVGAIIFGLSADYFGRKYTYILIAALFIPAEIGCGFVQTYSQFLGVRALFGVLMGGMYSISMVTAMEDQPPQARGALSGIFLPGYSFGYLLAMVFYRAFALTGKDGEGWRNLLFFTAGLSLILIIWRLSFPESPTYLRLKEKKRQFNEQRKEGKKGFLSKFDLTIFEVLRTEWLMFIYLVILYAIFNFTTHASQDLYSSMLSKQYLVDIDLKTIIIVVSNLGAMCGGLIMGNVSEILGRRLTVLICMLWNIAFTWGSFVEARKHWPLYVFLQAGVMGAWGVGPIMLLELVNPTLRALLAGLAYQLGNLASSASSTIEAKISERFPLGTEGMYDYGKVMGIFCYCVFGCMIICVFLGPERFHRELRMVDDGEVLEEVSSHDYSEKDKV